MQQVYHRAVLEQVLSEHRALNGRLEEFARGLFDAAHRAEAEGRLRELVIAIGMHFGFEESLMEDRDYAAYEHHRRQHLGIMTELGLLLDRIEGGEDSAGLARSADLLARWYGDHVGDSDQALLDWLAAAAEVPNGS